MGSAYTRFHEAKFPETKPKMFSLSITGRDDFNPHILLTYCPPEVRDVIRMVILESWPAGIKKDEELTASGHWFKMHFHPFDDQTFSNEIMVKNMMAQILARVGQMSWIPLVGCDTQAEEDISTIFFYRGDEPIFVLKVRT